MYPNLRFWVHVPIFAAPNLNNNTMKKVLFIIAIVFAAMVANAQHYELANHVDTLTYQQLSADYVSLNKQLMDFKTYELVSAGFGFVSTGFSLGSALAAAKNPDASRMMLIIAGVGGVASVVTWLAGYTKIKRDRLEITPNGVIIKLTPKTNAEIFNRQ